MVEHGWWSRDLLWQLLMPEELEAANDDDEEDDIEALDAHISVGGLTTRRTNKMQTRIRKIGDGLGEILDGDVLRVGMADSKTSSVPLRMTDGTNDAYALHRPGFRIERGGNIGDVLVRDGGRRDREEQYRLRDEEMANAYKNVSPSWSDAATAPKNSTEPGWLLNNERFNAEGTACTCRNEEFPEYVGAPGKMAWVPRLALPCASRSR